MITDENTIYVTVEYANREWGAYDHVVHARVYKKLRQQLAAMTAERDRLLGVMCEIAGSKSLTATPTQFYQHLQRVASNATITNPEALAATADLDGLILCDATPIRYLYRYQDAGGQTVWVSDTAWQGMSPLETMPLYRTKEQ